MIEIDRNSRRAIERIKGLKRLTREGVEYAAWTSARGLVRATSADILRRPKGGRTYTRRDRAGRRRRHVASAPLETHANDSGDLRKSLGFRVTGFELEFGYGVQSPKPAPTYAEWVEFGTSIMKPRPSLQNNLRGERRNMMNNFEREIRSRLREG